MNPHPTWAILIPSIFLIYLGYYLGGFFQINYLIGGLGLLLGIYNLYKEKRT